MEVFALLYALASAVAAGVAGLFPFVHSNSLVAFFQSHFSNPIQAAVFFAALGVAQLVFSSFPAVFFGLPSQSQGISVLPAHSLSMEGKGLQALQAMLYSIFIALLLSLAAAPAFFFFSQAAYPFLAPLTLPLLVVIVALFFYSEKNLQKILAGLAIFTLSGIFGFVVLSYSFVADPLLPLLTGLFGLPLLLLSFSSAQPPKQLPTSSALPKVSKAHVAAGVLLGAASTFIPAVSPAVASSAAFLLLAQSTPLDFIALSTAVSASKAVFDVEAAFSIGKARSGVAAAVMQSASPGSHWLALSAVAIAGFACIALAMFFSKPAATVLSSLPQRKISLAILAAVALGLFASGGPFSLAIAVVACLVGLLPPLFGLRHAYLTGALILPTLLYYAGVSHLLLAVISGL